MNPESGMAVYDRGSNNKHIQTINCMTSAILPLITVNRHNSINAKVEKSTDRRCTVAADRD